jgi:MFS family permease
VAIEHSAGSRTPSPGQPGPSRRLIFGIVAVALFMSSIDTTIVATALPAIHTSLRATINWAGWTITIYSLGMVVVLPIAGKISDEFGRRRVFL